MVQFPAAAGVPTYDIVFSIRHSHSEGPPTVVEYDQAYVGGVNSTRRPAPARMHSDASPYDPQGFEVFGLQ